MNESVIVYRSQGEKYWDEILYNTDFSLYLVGGLVIVLTICGIVYCVKKCLRNKSRY